MTASDIRAFYATLGIQLPAWSKRDAPFHCFAHPEPHDHGDRSPSCSVSLTSGAWNCHGCGVAGAPTTLRSPPATRRARQSSC